MRQVPFLLACILLLSSCSTYNFYLTNTTADVYEQQPGNVIGSLPANEMVVVKESKPNKYYYPVSHRGLKGYVRTSALKYHSKASKTSYVANSKVPQTSTNTYTRNTSKPYYSSGSKTVQVKGYTRKDGTYVKPHTRSAPKKRS